MLANGDRSMFKVRIERIINKDIETVFELLSDHANYKQFPGIQDSKLLEPGKDEPNGIGALRFIDGGSLKFVERITDFQRPVKLNYLIEQSKPIFIEHQIGEIRLSKVEQGTHVEWVSEGHFSIPLLGYLIDKLSEKQIQRAFGAVLKGVAQSA